MSEYHKASWLLLAGAVLCKRIEALLEWQERLIKLNEPPNSTVQLDASFVVTRIKQLDEGAGTHAEVNINVQAQWRDPRIFDAVRKAFALRCQEMDDFKERMCVDTSGFLDEKNYSCSRWQSTPCIWDNLWERYNYSKEGADDVLANCGATCGFCNDKCQDKKGFLDEHNNGCTFWSGYFCKPNKFREFGFSDAGVEAVKTNCRATCGACIGANAKVIRVEGSGNKDLNGLYWPHGIRDGRRFWKAKNNARIEFWDHTVTTGYHSWWWKDREGNYIYRTNKVPGSSQPPFDGWFPWTMAVDPQPTMTEELVDCSETGRKINLLPLQGILTGSIHELHEGAVSVIENLLGENASQYTAAYKQGFWSPFSASNPTYDEVMYYADTTDRVFTGELSQAKSIQVPFKFSYRRYPFDEQCLSICVAFQKQAQVASGQKWLVADGHDRYRWYESSALSPHVTKRAVDDLDSIGFTAVGVEISVRTAGGPELCTDLILHRQYGVTILRLFGPLFMLVCTSFVGFWLPIESTMPRVATGFITFLALQVFTKRSYDMQPKTSFSITILDTVVFTITEILFLVVIQNLVAQHLNARWSHFAALRLDAIARRVFPASTIFFVLFVFLSGSAISIMVEFIILQCLLALVFFGVLIHMARYMRNLPHEILRKLISDMNSEKVLWRVRKDLGDRDLAITFRCLDKDLSGTLCPDEIVASFKEHGLMFSVRECDTLTLRIRETCGEEVTLHDFRSHFGLIFGADFVRFKRESQRCLSKIKSEPESVEVPIIGKQASAAEPPASSTRFATL